MNSDLETLLHAAAYGGHVSGAEAVIAGLTESLTAGISNADATRARGPAELAVEVKKLVDTATAAHVVSARPAQAFSTSASSEERSVGETVVRTAAMMTGVGPLVTGLMKLFGSSDSDAVPALEKFSAPTPVAVQAGLTRDREYSALRYAQGNTPDALSQSPIRSGHTTVQVNIQAMDSQSFLDRQDDIARAVREAMLHSNSLNDVVLEL